MMKFFICLCVTLVALPRSGTAQGDWLYGGGADPPSASKGPSPAANGPDGVACLPRTTVKFIVPYEGAGSVPVGKQTLRLRLAGWRAVTWDSESSSFHISPSEAGSEERYKSLPYSETDISFAQMALRGGIRLRSNTPLIHGEYMLTNRVIAINLDNLCPGGRLYLSCSMYSLGRDDVRLGCRLSEL
jgi:hypothetical protein